jgi:hypothetical protein
MSDLAGAVSVLLRPGLDSSRWMIVQVLVKDDGHGFSARRVRLARWPESEESLIQPIRRDMAPAQSIARPVSRE